MLFTVDKGNWTFKHRWCHLFFFHFLLLRSWALIYFTFSSQPHITSIAMLELWWINFLGGYPAFDTNLLSSRKLNIIRANKLFFCKWMQDILISTPNAHLSFWWILGQFGRIFAFILPALTKGTARMMEGRREEEYKVLCW